MSDISSSDYPALFASDDLQWPAGWWARSFHRDGRTWIFLRWQTHEQLQHVSQGGDDIAAAVYCDSHDRTLTRVVYND
jgi:hypothetical protein